MKYKYYATKLTHRDSFNNFNTNPISFKSGIMAKPNEMIYEVCLEECNEDEMDYIAWRDFSTNKISMIFRTRMQLSVCFTYGLEKAIETNRGEIVFLRLVSAKEVCFAKDLQ